MRKESNKYPPVMKLSFCGLILSVMLLLNLSGAVFSEVMTSPLVFASPQEPPDEGQPDEGEADEGQPEGEADEGQPEGEADEPGVPDTGSGGVAQGPIVPLPLGEICDDSIDNNGDGQVDEGCSLGAESVPLPPEGSDFTGVERLPQGKLVLPPEPRFEGQPPPGFDPNLPPDGTTPPPVDDPSAEPPQIPPTTVPIEQGSCNDGVDNDNDGLTDSQDSSDECGFEQLPPGFDPFGP
jgi:hypothetical protein